MYSDKWFPQNFLFDNNNPFHLYILKQNISNIIKIIFGKEYSVDYYSVDDIMNKNNNIIYIDHNIKNIDNQIGYVLLSAFRKKCDFNIHQIISNSGISDIEYEKLELICHVLSFHNALAEIKKVVPGYLKFIKKYLDYNFKILSQYTSETISTNKILLHQLFKKVLTENNWDTFSYHLLKFHLEESSISEIKNIQDKLKKEKQLDEELFFKYFTELYTVLQSINTNKENDYSTLEEAEIKKLTNTIERYESIIFNKLKLASIRYSLKSNIIKYDTLKIKQEKVNYKLNEPVNILYLDELNSASLDNKLFDLFETNPTLLNYNQKIILPDGIKIGRKILSQLKYRDNNKIEKNNYLLSGKLNKRFLYKIPLEDKNIYYREIDQTKKHRTVYIVVDASKSMQDDKWDKTQKFVISLIYAISNIRSLDIEVYYRRTLQNQNKSVKNLDINPFVLKAYDSKKDKFEKVKKYFKYLKPSGGSPEGIVLDYLSNKLKQDSIVINISDGLPEFYNHSISYTGTEANDHTKKQIKKLMDKNINFISYFIGDRNDYEKYKTIYKHKHFYVPEEIDKLGLTLNEVLFDEV